MNDESSSPPPGFTLESADSVRFGPEYTDEEQERNRQVLFGEALCGLLFGEPLWTNAVFAFDSRGMIEVLGALSRAFEERKREVQFLPFRMAVYPGDADSWANAFRPWENPAEIFLRCYSHRLRNHGFQLSATPGLEPDRDRRTEIAEIIRKASETGQFPGDLTTRGPGEAGHFMNIASIDKFLRSSLGPAGSVTFDAFAQRSDISDFPIAKNREGWERRYGAGKDFSSIPGFFESAISCVPEKHAGKDYVDSALAILKKCVDRSKIDEVFRKEKLRNRSSVRNYLKDDKDGEGLKDSDETFRVLIEMLDGHYMSSQYSELTFASREVSSPASLSPSSQAGEDWATATKRNCLVASESSRRWQFINKISAVAGLGTLKIDLDGIADRFADYVAHPERRADLFKYHRLLTQARSAQEGIGGRGASDARFEELSDHVHDCVDRINRHMTETGVEFHFNENQKETKEGSLTLSYLKLSFPGAKAMSQMTGPEDADTRDYDEQIRPGENASEGGSHSIMASQ